jgi:hypothetical protein
MHSVHPQSAVIASRSPSEIVPNAEKQRCAGVAILPHWRVFVLASWRSAHAWIERACPSGLDAARPDLTAKFPELAANIDHLERAAQQAATTFESEPAATPDAFSKALRVWEATALDGLAALDNARSSQLCIDCGAEVATVKTGLGQRVCTRCLREGATP